MTKMREKEFMAKFELAYWSNVAKYFLKLRMAPIKLWAGPVFQDKRQRPVLFTGIVFFLKK